MTGINARTLPEPDVEEPGAMAVQRLMKICLSHQGGGTRPLAEFLVSLYNAQYARPDMYLLCRRIDDVHFKDVLEAMQWFRRAPGGMDLHCLWGERGGEVMVALMDSFGLGPE